MIDTGHAGAAPHPCANLAGDAFEGGALGPAMRGEYRSYGHGRELIDTGKLTRLLEVTGL